MKLNKTQDHLKELDGKDAGDTGKRCNQVSLTVKLQPDPYAHDIHDDKTLYFMCDDCAYNSLKISNKD